jgi:hypothetical protein
MRINLMWLPTNHRRKSNMTAQAGTMLVEQIAPRLRTLVPKSVKPVGAEDPEELLQDALAIAANMLHRVEQSGKQFTPGNIAYYVILHMRSGRRSQGSSRVDTMGIGTQLDGSSSVLSFEEEVGYDPELDAPITLGELLASEHEDPAMKASRNIDWELFIRTHDYRYGIMIKGIAEGQSLKATAEASEHLYASLYGLKERLAADVREYLGEEAVADSVKTPKWKACINRDREKASCRADRRRR